jgi:uncharacterized protein
MLGYRPSQSTLGVMCLFGQGVAVDEKCAATWLSTAADAGDIQAQSLLGMMYLSGKAVPPNKGLARYWLSRAAAGGDREASQLLRTYFPSTRE